MERTIKNNFIELLRFACTILIVLRHRSGMGFSITTGRYASILVEFFFLLSGMFMARSAEQEQVNGASRVGAQTLRYVGRKYGRFIHYYVFAFILAFLLSAIAERYSLKQTLYGAGFSVFELLMIRMGGVAPGLWYNGSMWYLSAMLLAILLLYPILLRRYEVFSRVFAPLIAVVGYGILFQNTKDFTDAGLWLGIGYASTLRAIAAMSLGCFAWECVKGFLKLQFRAWVKHALTILELLGWALVLTMSSYRPDEWANFNAINLVIVTAMFCLIVVSLSGQSDTHRILAGHNLGFLSKYGVCLYFCHRCWTWWFKANPLPSGAHCMTAAYLLCAFTTALVCLFVCDWLRGKKPRRLFLKEER